MILSRLAAMAAGLWFGLAGCPLIAGEDAVDPASATRDTILVQSVTRVLSRSHPRLKADTMLDYYSRTGPDIFAEIRSQIESGAHDPGPYLRRLADHFEKMERMRRRNPTEFSRLVALEQLESRARMLGRRIQQLTVFLAAGGEGDATMTKGALNAAKEELRSALERAFEASQQNQRIEVNRLEAELRAMRRLLDERDAKRDLILQQRYLQLSGQEMPVRSPGPVAADDQSTTP